MLVTALLGIKQSLGTLRPHPEVPASRAALSSAQRTIWYQGLNQCKSLYCLNVPKLNHFQIPFYYY